MSVTSSITHLHKRHELDVLQTRSFSEKYQRQKQVNQRLAILPVGKIANIYTRQRTAFPSK
jgi:hypothetical protein